MPVFDPSLALAICVQWEGEDNERLTETCALDAIVGELATLIMGRYAVHVSILDTSEDRVSFEANATRPRSLVLDNRKGSLSLGEEVAFRFSFYHEGAPCPHLAASVSLALIPKPN